MSRNSSKLFQRITNQKPPRKRFLILCEGAETEPNYFKSFQQIGRDNQTVTIIIEPLGAVGITVVTEAIKRKQQDGDYEEDEVWCVFDRDAKKENNNKQNFNEAIRLAFENKLNLAVSNDAFELWFLLHYEYYQSETHRSDLKEMLSENKRLGEKYEKNSENMYEKLKDKQFDAIKFAKKLWNSHKSNDNENDEKELSVQESIERHNQNPSTTVYKLVEKLNEIIIKKNKNQESE
ncbi:RloB family protein [Crocosphaera sp. XPORK-15E]|uniref:RloB family protein n=1 Tax=Crocosphaera sp. XPORK-15E TaxID=3110247 RepID=UPI002B208C14|nr:RloB family protein [Crocosphaera sp. XPORK-15E]MEA5534858.1 RloB family protein [Crocosphaera sp. XPORK-15E]